MYIYRKTETQLWTVGFYDPSGKWNPESDHDNKTDAAERTAWLNGSGDNDNESPAETIRKNADAKRWSK
jgi:hypothetical protein